MVSYDSIKSIIVIGAASLAFTAAPAHAADTTTPDPAPASAASTLSVENPPVLTNPDTGEEIKTVVLKDHVSKKAAKKSKPSRKAALELVERTGWPLLVWRGLRCAGGAWGGWWASAMLPGWVRVGSVISGCVVAW